MRKRIAVMLALAMILGTACALAEEEEEIEDLTGGWELYAGGQSELYVYLERDGAFRRRTPGTGTVLPKGPGHMTERN